MAIDITPYIDSVALAIVLAGIIVLARWYLKSQKFIVTRFTDELEECKKERKECQQERNVLAQRVSRLETIISKS